jgi:hypothetical protein
MHKGDHMVIRFIDVNSGQEIDIWTPMQPTQFPIPGDTISFLGVDSSIYKVVGRTWFALNVLNISVSEIEQ